MNVFQRLFSNRAQQPLQVDEPAVEAGDALHSIVVQVDRPISSATEDLFDRAPFAKQIATVIATRADPSSLVIGLYGPWGDGKTSTLSMIKEALGGNQDILTMDYNPWFYGANTEAITKSFFKSIKETLVASGFFNREAIGEILSLFGSIIPVVGDAVENVGDALSTEALTSTRDKVGALLTKHGKKIVIFIDDIDRLDRQDIQTLFKLVRLSGGFDHTTYVLAFDDTIVAEALGEAYGSGDPIAGRRFLEKIVQVPLHLPAASPETLRKLMFAACDRVIRDNGLELPEGHNYELGNGLASGFVHALKTPRQVKLLDNALTFAVPLLKGEVRLVDQLLIEAVRVFYPSIYEAIRKNPSDVLQARERNNRNVGRVEGPVEVAIDALDVSAAEKTALRELLADLFPRRSNMGYGSDFDAIWAGEKRVCSRDYFNRYFTYTVPTGDVPDLAVTQLIESAAAGDDGAVATGIDQTIERNSFEVLIRKLRIQETTIPLAAVRPLALAIATRATRVPTNADIFSGDFTFSQAALLVSKLVERLERDDQTALLVEVAEQTDSLRFIPEILRWAQLRPQEAGDDRGYLEAERSAPLAAIIFRRLTEMAAASNVFDATQDRLGRILYAIEFYGSDETKTELMAYIAEVLERDPLNAIRFIRTFAGRTQGEGVPRVGNLSRDGYNGMAGLFDTDRVFQRLQEIYGDQLRSDEFRDDWNGGGDADKRISDQFAYLHTHPMPAEAEEGEDPEQGR